MSPDGFRILQQVSAHLILEESVQPLYEKLVEAAVAIMRSDFASMQMLDRNRGELQLLAFCGFSAEAAIFWEWVTLGSGSTCGEALRTGKRVVVPDIEQCDFIAGSDDLATYRQTGIRAVQTTPLKSRNGEVLGMISTHWHQRHSPSGRDLRMFDLLARQAADLIECKATEVALRKSEGRYRQLAESLEIEVAARTRELEERNAEVSTQSAQLQKLSWELLRAQDQERRKFSRDLHDSAGQTLAVLGMSIGQFVKKAEAKAPELSDEVNGIREVIRQLDSEIRTASYLLHPPLLEVSGLAAALTWYVDGLSNRSGMNIRIQIPHDFGRLPRDMELMVFRVVQECLTNIHKHSESKTAVIRLVRGLNGVSIEVADKGKGIAAERLAELHSGRFGVGIAGMHERVRQFAGTMSIESSQVGTRILATIPVRSSDIAGQPESAPSSQISCPPA